MPCPNLAQTTLRSVCGQAELDELLSARDKINSQLQEILDMHTDPWGIKVATVELKHIDLPQEMQRSMAKQAEAERERRAKIINADGEFQAATKLAEAAEIMREHPMALQLRYLQTMREIVCRAEYNDHLSVSYRSLQAVSGCYGQNKKGRKGIKVIYLLTSFKKIA